MQTEPFCMLTFRSWQRLGAVANATLSKYKHSTEIQYEGETLTIVRVVDHKMGLFGSAKLVLSRTVGASLC